MISTAIHHSFKKFIFFGILSSILLSLCAPLNADDLVRFRWEKDAAPDTVKTPQVQKTEKETADTAKAPQAQKAEKVQAPPQKVVKKQNKITTSPGKNPRQEGIHFRWENGMTAEEKAIQENPPYLQERRYPKGIRLSRQSPQFNRRNLIPAVAQDEYPKVRSIERIHNDTLTIVKDEPEKASHDLTLTEGQNTTNEDKPKEPRRRELKLPKTLAREYVGNIQLTNPEDLLVYFDPEEDKKDSDTRVAIPVKGTQLQPQEAHFESDANYRVE